MSLTLYGYFRSSASARVRTVMELHGIAREDKFVHLLKGEQRSPEYTAMNPTQTLPTLVVKEADGTEWSLSQCIAIMEYLDETYGGPKYLLPRDARGRATVRSIVDLVVGDLFPMLTMGTLNRVKQLGADANQWTEMCSKQFLGALEGMLAKTSGKYCYGDDITLADVALSTQISTVLRFCPDILPAYPTVAAVYGRVSVLPEFVKADWKHQPDTPEEFRK